MLLSYLWVGMLAVSVLYGAAAGTLPAVSAAMMEGAADAVTLCISICGTISFWSGCMEVMRACGLTDALARCLSPLLRRIFPCAFQDPECAAAISANFSANLLGLGNAATPAGITAARRMVRIPGAASELCRLVVMNSASLQLLPTTIAAVRSACGAGNAFDILPCIWLTSLCSVCTGLLCTALPEGRK